MNEFERMEKARDKAVKLNNGRSVNIEASLWKQQTEDKPETIFKIAVFTPCDVCISHRFNTLNELETFLVSIEEKQEAFMETLFDKPLEKMEPF